MHTKVQVLTLECSVVDDDVDDDVTVLYFAGHKHLPHSSHSHALGYLYLLSGFLSCTVVPLRCPVVLYLAGDVFFPCGVLGLQRQYFKLRNFFSFAIYIYSFWTVLYI